MMVIYSGERTLNETLPINHVEQSRTRRTEEQDVKIFVELITREDIKVTMH
jgi:hypothetical protein